MLVTMLISAVGVNRTPPRHLLGGWAFALAFRREVFASLDVSRSCLSQGSLLCWKRTCGRNPSKKLNATDASPSGAGGCVAPNTREAWLALYDVAEEKGEQVRLGKAMNHRAACAMDAQPLRLLALQLSRATLCSSRFFRRQRESPTSRLRRVAREGIRGTTALGTCRFTRGFGSCLERALELTKDQLLTSEAWVLVPRS